jgi:hypothetical protein
MIRSKVIYVSGCVGDLLVVNIKALEFISVLVSYIGFIIEAINSKALYDRYDYLLDKSISYYIREEHK